MKRKTTELIISLNENEITCLASYYSPNQVDEPKIQRGREIHQRIIDRVKCIDEENQNENSNKSNQYQSNSNILNTLTRSSS